MRNGIVLCNDLLPDAALEVLSEQTGYEKKYLTDGNPASTWRSTSISQQTVQASFESPAQVEGIAVINHNLVSGDTFEFEASSDGFSSIAASASIDPEKGFVEVDWNYPDYRLRLQKVSGDYIQVGQLYLPRYVYEFELNYNWNYDHLFEAAMISHQLTSGVVKQKKRYHKEGFSFSFTNIPDSQKNMLVTAAKSPYVCIIPTSYDQPFFGPCTVSNPKHTGPNSWNCTLTFWENPST